MERFMRLGKQAEKAIEAMLARRFGLTYPQYQVLAFVAQQNSDNLGNIADVLGCSGGNLTGIGDRLERDGWVERERGREDRRVITLKLTTKGTALYDQVQAAISGILPAVPDPILDGLANLVAQLETAACK